MIKIDNFDIWLADAAKRIGAHSACCVRLDHPDLVKAIRENNERIHAWLSAGKHGEMDYLERMFSQKSNPWKTFPNAKAVIVLTFTNGWGDANATHPFPDPESDETIGYISSYAREIDYHNRGQAMLNELHQLLGYEIEAESAVDTKPIDERLFATFGGLGIIGANNLLRVPDRTNVRVFIGTLFVNAELPNVIHDVKMPFSCNDCMACISNCPTDAIKPGMPIDAPKCISYLTIEKRTVLNRLEAEMIEDWIFGCDHCSNVCPPKEKIDSRIPIDLSWLLKTPAGEIRRLIRDNATSYAGVTRLRRNAIALLKLRNNSKSSELLQWTYKRTGSELLKQQLNAW